MASDRWMDFETHLLDPRLLVPVKKTTWQDSVCECKRWNPTLPYAQAKMCPSGNTETSHPSSQPSRLSRLDDLLANLPSRSIDVAKPYKADDDWKL